MNNLQAKRIEAGLTQKQLAEKIGVSWKTVQHWELNGTKGAGVESIRKAAEVLGADIPELIF